MVLSICGIALLGFCGAVLVAGQGNQGEPPKRGALSGTVVEGKSGDPVRKAVVILGRGQEPGVGITTDAAGKFELRDLDPGTYTLTVERDGYVPAKESQRQVVTLNAGETTADVKLKLVRTGAISGRVLDADGEAVTGATIQVLPLRTRKGREPAGWWASTDDRGEYRAFGVPPGEYRIAAVYGADRGRHIEVHMQSSAGDAWPTAWYPGTVDVRQAATVTVEPGAELQGYDVQLIRMSGVRVRGRVVNAGGNSPAFVMVMLQPLGPPGEPVPGQSHDALVRDAKGEFEITSVLPGKYRLRAVSGGFNQENQLTAERMLDVGASNVEGIQLTLSPPYKVSGRMIPPADRKLPPGLMVVLGSREPVSSRGGMSQVAADGSFSIKDVAAGDYDVLIGSAGAGDDLYVSAIRMGDADALGDGVHIGEGPPASLEIILKANGGTAECTVKDAKGAALPDAEVLLVPDPPKQRQSALYGQCRTLANGACTLQGITPGEYHAYAFLAGTEVNSRDADALKPFAKSGKPVKLAEGERQAIELEVISEE